MHEKYWPNLCNRNNIDKDIISHNSSHNDISEFRAVLRRTHWLKRRDPNNRNKDIASKYFKSVLEI